MQPASLPRAAGRDAWVLTLIVLLVPLSGIAQPRYVEVGDLPVPTASERAEVYDATSGTWFSFPYYDQIDLTSVYYARHSETGLVWTQTTSFPARTTYWGRGVSDGRTLYFSGTIDSVSKLAGINSDGSLGAWRPMTLLPTPSGGRGRSLHQSFIYQGRLYIAGGWYGDDKPSYADTYYAPIQGDGTVGSFTPTTSLPQGAAGHSMTVSSNGIVYLVKSTNIYMARIAADGSIQNWTRQPPIPGLNHNNLGNTAITLVKNFLVIVDHTNTFVCSLNSSGQVMLVMATIPNPAYFDQRSVYAIGGKPYITATTGKMYRIDDLPELPENANWVPRTDWIAFNDHLAAPGTGSYTTVWNTFTNLNIAPGNSGPLKNVFSGTNLPVILTITNSGATASRSAGVPMPETPAYKAFKGFVSFSTDSPNRVIQVGSSATVVYVFTGLDPAKSYNFMGTAVRGTNNTPDAVGYPTRWTMCELVGAQSFAPAHTPGVLTSAQNTNLTATQCAFNSGLNLDGEVVAWEDIRVGTNGSFSVVCRQYLGPIPGGTAGGSHGYGLTAIRLEQRDPAKYVLSPSLAQRTQNRVVTQGSNLTLAVLPDGMKPLRYQWSFNGILLVGATNSVLIRSNLTANQAGMYGVTVTDAFGASATTNIWLALVTALPGGQTQNAGDTANFTVTVEGTNLTYQWMFNGEAIPGATNAMLSLPNLQTNQAGNYSVQISNNGIPYVSPPAALCVPLPGQPGSKLWEFQAAGAIMCTPAIGQDGTIYVASVRNLSTGSGLLYALTPTGTVKWSASLPTWIGTPAIAQDGTIYVGAHYYVYAYNTNGQRKWRLPVGGAVFSSPAIGLDGTIYVPLANDDRRLLALNPDGTQKWEFDAGGRIYGSPVIGVDGTIYFGTLDNNKLFALAPDGTKRWEIKASGWSYGHPAIGQDGTIYFPIDGLPSLFCVNPDGSIRWTYSDSIGKNFTGAPAIAANGTVIVGAKGAMIALKSDGSVAWSTRFDKSLFLACPAISRRGTIYVQAEDRKIYAFDSLGRTNWTFATAGTPLTGEWRPNPVIGPDGTVYCGALDGKFYAIQGDEGPDESAWPMLRRDQYHASRIPLVFTNQLQSQSVTAGETVSFVAEVLSPEPVTYYWRRNGTNIPGVHTSTLTITNVQLADAGNYSVVASNASGAMASFPASLSVEATYFGLGAQVSGGGLILFSPLMSTFPVNSWVTLTAMPAEGWTFIDWKGSVTSTNPVITLQMTCDKTVRARFGTTVTAQGDGRGTVSLLPNAALYPYGSLVKVVAQPNTGNYFTGWSGSARGDVNPLMLTVKDGNPLIIGSFAPLPAGCSALTIIPYGAGRVAVTPRANYYTNGQSVTMLAIPEPGQQFVGWSGDATGLDNPLVVTINQSKIIAAQFTERPLLGLRQTACDGFIVSLSGQLRGAYRIESSDDLSHWVAVANLANYFGESQVVVPSINPRLFYRAASLTVGMELIPAGPFQMGDALDGSTDAPVHTVDVSAFWMDKFPVTKELWDSVYRWATNRGYSFNKPGMSKAPDHPVLTVNWYDAVKWCNARSEMEGLTPAYYTDAQHTAVYRIGQINLQNEWVKWNAGYRLPTEAEWEKAARGGFAGKRFPWGNTITHDQANYKSSTNEVYDLSSTKGFHPAFQINAYPYTSPVGYFAPNAYGLYDMAGNVKNWCWDWYSSSYYTSSPSNDPRGPSSGTQRSLRGGYWWAEALNCRVASRSAATPDSYNNSNYGFRTVLPANEP